MIKFNSERLARLGYRGLTATQYNQLNRELYQATEEIVGLKLASRLDEAELDEFEGFYRSDDDDGAFDWLRKAVPDYAEVVQGVVAELEALLEQTARETRAPFQRDLHADLAQPSPPAESGD
ncbi:MAG TPA: DUF5663 domain-containing protein [Solirubrobacterales bacterium]|nr:DUF5663 domain-containing protein [Solirubrobacterales bacterium]